VTSNQTERSLNPLFFVLSILSGIPTAFFALVYLFAGFNELIGVTFLWCGLWTWVWYKMADRYR
jgi:hypothetical protein